MQREFDASNTFSLYYEGKPGERLQRVDVGNINFVPPPSRFLTSSLPSGNYGIQVTNQFGPLQSQDDLRAADGQRRSEPAISSSAAARSAAVDRARHRRLSDRARGASSSRSTRALFGRAYPNIDILNRSQLAAHCAARCRTRSDRRRVLLYRLQFGTQPQNPNGPQFRLQGDRRRGTQTYDLLREGVDYYMDQSMLWFALVRPLNETNERLVVAYNVRINGRDTVVDDHRRHARSAIRRRRAIKSRIS